MAAQPIDPDTIHEVLRMVSPEMEQAISDKIENCLRLATETYGGTFNKPVVKYDLRGTTAGYANSKRIRLNIDLLFTEWDDMLHNTLPHEVAHTVVSQRWPRAKAHGEEWAHVMATFSLEARRCHSYEVEKVRKHGRPHVYHCECKGWRITNLLHKRMQSGQRRYCPTCKGWLIYSRTEET